MRYHVISLLTEKEKDENALQHYQEVLQIVRKVVKENPTNDDYKFDLANVLSDLAKLENKLNLKNKTLQHYQEAISIYKISQTRCLEMMNINLSLANTLTS